MAWRLALALETLRKQVNAAHPNRSKNSDGSIGDEAHASRSSDHNPWIKDGGKGLVSAIDITHDPVGGFDSYRFAEVLRGGRDARIKYIISNGKICSGSEGPQPWQWRKYTGKNKHDHHIHISVKSDKAHYDDEKPWAIDAAPAAEVKAAPYTAPPETLRRGARGDQVKRLQAMLTADGYAVKIDGDFGPTTYAAVRKFQLARKLVADGVVGPQTWKELA